MRSHSLIPTRYRTFPTSSLSLFVFAFFLLSAALLVVTPPAYAQRAARVRPAFDPKLVKRMRVSGTVRFKIVARRDGLPHEFAPIGSNGWAAVLRINGHVRATLTKLPAEVEWDTRAAGDGIHEILVTVRNARANQEVGIEGGQVIVDNAAADTEADAAAIASARVASQDATGAAIPPPVLTVPEAAKATTAAVRFSTSLNPLAARVTALWRSGSRLYLGLPDGGIAFCTPEAPSSRGGSVVRLAAEEKAVRSLTVGGGRVWWTTEGGRAVYAYQDATHTVTRYDVTAALLPAPLPDAAKSEPDSKPEEPTEAPRVPNIAPTLPAPTPKKTGWVRRIALLRGRVLLIGDGGTVRVLDPPSGKMTDAAEVEGLLPDIVSTDGTTDAASRGPARWYITSATDAADAPAVAVVVTPAPLPEQPPATDASSGGEDPVTGPKPASTVAAPRWRRCLLRAWRIGQDGEWCQVAAFATDADPDRAARLAIAPDALVTAEREGPRFLGVDHSAATETVPRDLPYALSPGMPSSTEHVAVGASGLWWEQRGILFRAEPRSGAREVYLPWNLPGEAGAVLALTADKDGLWVATTSMGVRRIRPGRPTARDGYNGYIRARLGQDSLQPPTPRDKRIAYAIELWQGVPYVWGGQSRSGADCSGFVMRMHQVGGVSIPRTSAGMRNSSRGRRVRDELRWGDTLVYPGHCAIYIGDGRTAETVGGSREGGVSRSTIWVRSSVVVRRFLP
jgi:hypothetical protein